MKEIIIRKTATPTERIILQTNAESVDGLFTVMTVSGSIEGLFHDFKPGTIASLDKIGVFLADHADDAIEAVVLDNDAEEEKVITAIEKFLFVAAAVAKDKATYNKFAAIQQKREYDYDEVKDTLPWLMIKTDRNIKSKTYDLEISKDGTALTFAENAAQYGTIAETKLTTDCSYIQLAVNTDLGVEDVSGTYTLKFTFGDDVVTREVVID